MPPRAFFFTLACCIALTGAAQGFQPPEPFGGEQSVKWFFEEELRYSSRDLEAKVEGVVQVTFTVGADGTPKGLRITRTLSEDTETEALRLAALIRWHPASVGGSALDKTQTLDVPFNVKRYLKLHAKDDPAAKPFLAFPADMTLQLYPDRGTDTLATPLIPKGLRGLGQYFGENLVYPEDARRRDMQGKVTVEFVVETSGSVSNLRTVEALSGGCDDEAMRLVRTIRWKPAFKNGQRVRSIMKLEIQFRLDANQRP